MINSEHVLLMWREVNVTKFRIQLNQNAKIKVL
jgi:hypothetical protein